MKYSPIEVSYETLFSSHKCSRNNFETIKSSDRKKEKILKKKRSEKPNSKTEYSRILWIQYMLLPYRSAEILVTKNFHPTQFSYTC